MTTATNQAARIQFVVKPMFRCGQCGGNVAWDRDEDGYECIQCGRPHDNNGNLIRCRNGNHKRSVR